MTSPRVVLDTNCLISALIFKKGRLAVLREGWQNNRFTPLICSETAEELIRVLAYPKFHLSEAEIQIALDAFLPHVETTTLPGNGGKIAGLSDASDAVFVHLARHAKADWLVTGDEHLLTLPFQAIGIRVITPGEFVQRLGPI